MSETIKQISPKDFWGKIARVPKVAGCEIVEKAVTLYVLLTEGDFHWWLRGSILACLAYFLWPLDAIPDYLSGGYLDDLAANLTNNRSPIWGGAVQNQEFAIHPSPELVKLFREKPYQGQAPKEASLLFRYRVCSSVGIAMRHFSTENPYCFFQDNG